MKKKEVIYRLKHKKEIEIIGGLLLIFLAGFLFIKLSFSFELKGDQLLQLSYKDHYEEEGATLSFFGQDLSKKIKISGEVTDGKVGEYKIKYSYHLAFIPFSKTRKVSVVDTEKPTIELVGEKSQTMCPNKEYEEEGYRATDEYDGDLTDKVEVVQEENAIKYKVTDSSGNTTVVAREVKKEDTTKPTITLTGGNVITVQKNTSYKESGYKATDGCDGDLTDQVKVEGEVDTSKLGNYKIKYKVADSSGNETTVERTVVVTETASSAKGVIYLTFDDGPSGSGSTSKILDILKEEGVQATFFVTGSGPDSLIKRAHEEGHAIALHTYTHQYQNIYRSVDAYFSDLEKIQNRVKSITGETSWVIRFPGGSNNTISNKYNSGIMPILRQQALEKGYTYFDWNVDASDAYECAKSSVTDKKGCVYENVTSTLSKKRANVVLMHDLKSYTADALADIIHYAKENGYVFDVITKDTAPVRFR